MITGVTGRFQAIIRQKNQFVRYGGEEFVILLARANPGSAHKFAERIRIAIVQAPFECNGRSLEVTLNINIGVACCGYPAWSLQVLVEQADSLLC